MVKLNGQTLQKLRKNKFVNVMLRNMDMNITQMIIKSNNTLWFFNININKGEIDMKKAILTLSLIFITYYLTFKYMWIKELKY
ncbi:conserved hypothetical protein [Staphylococcus aureus]|nr:conserved hypothetical protein [Staphylococcus aureus]CRI11708.1 conserved hypothetical protein [Staphylococcus aureus]CRI14438.1 conserved hypothetical protein [Staphylococcus aureus]CRI18562.1 conserved hypothetical protein [Staphylococcus aureus]CRI23812.1 conserved hypothetical protein [Staphylococcus aureus]